MARARPSGFTLIETVVAIVILAVAVPPMLWAVAQAQQQRANPMLASKARWLAVEKLEDVIADRHSTGRGWAWLEDTATYYPDEAKGSITGYPQFSRTVTENETLADLVTGDADGGYKTVTVTVTWTNAEGTSQSLSISTVLTLYVPT
ncbi:MAG: type IV pilus modification PilV family protein [Planctomycetota bacterium]|jgi:prepilin-type N-terminal cleavage/methylation domain-containing protein